MDGDAGPTITGLFSGRGLPMGRSKNQPGSGGGQAEDTKKSTRVRRRTGGGPPESAGKATWVGSGEPATGGVRSGELATGELHYTESRLLSRIPSRPAPTMISGSWSFLNFTSSPTVTS